MLRGDAFVVPPKQRHLLCAVAARLFAAPVDHFFDDYLEMDLAAGRGSAQLSIDTLHNAVRFRLEPRKRKQSAAEQVELGVRCDLRRASSHSVVYFSPTPERLQRVLDELDAHERAGAVSPGAAEALFGSIPASSFRRRTAR